MQVNMFYKLSCNTITCVAGKQDIKLQWVFVIKSGDTCLGNLSVKHMDLGQKYLEMDVLSHTNEWISQHLLCV
jgi:hypothetical protein